MYQHGSSTQLGFKGVRLVEKLLYCGVMPLVKTAAEQHNCECDTQSICELVLLILGKDSLVCLKCECWRYICNALFFSFAFSHLMASE